MKKAYLFITLLAGLSPVASKAQNSFPASGDAVMTGNGSFSIKTTGGETGVKIFNSNSGFTYPVAPGFVQLYGSQLYDNGNGIELGCFAETSLSMHTGDGPTTPITIRFNAKTNGITYFNAGNVGIGTTTPDEKLTVNGLVHAKEVKIDATIPTPDYVFKDDYKLRSLSEVESYIKKNSHLPEVPSAAEVEKNGIKVSEMSMILLKKVEELTLYLLEKDKKIKTQEQQVADQVKVIAREQVRNKEQQVRLDKLEAQLKFLFKEKAAETK